MAEAIALGIVVSLLQQGIPAAISKLKARFQQAKATEGETRELEDFLRSVHDCSTKYQNTCGGKVKTISSTTSSFAKTLDDVKKTLDSWSSQNSGFFSRSSGERVEALRSLRRTVENAINVEILGMLRDQQRMLDSILNHVRNNNLGKPPKRHPPSIDTQQPPTPIHHPRQPRAEAPKNQRSKSTGRPSTNPSKPPTPIHHPRQPRVEAPKNQRSNSTDRPSTNPSKPPALNRSRSKSVQRDQHHSSEKRRIVDLWVSLDSEKQANDVVNKLQGLQDVKKVFYDLVTKKVSVKLGEGSKIDIATLLSEIQNAQPKGKVAPTRWLQRPR